MKLAPVAVMTHEPFVLPVFSDLWKAACMTCKHYHESTSENPVHAKMQCKAVPMPMRNTAYASCGEARGDRGLCGPRAKLREAK